MADIKDINDAEFETVVLNSTEVTLVDFYAPWCGPCRKMSEIVSQIADEYKDKVKIVKLNTDENLKTAKSYSISSLPSILIFKDGETKERLVGMLQKSSIITNIEKYL